VNTSAARIKRYRRENLTFDVIDSGPMDGTPVVLLHGFPQRASDWDAVASRLHAAGFRTFAPDQRGYSPGARPRSRFAYRFKVLVDDVVALIDQIGGTAHVAGHDLGAALGWSLAARHPEKVLSLTAVSVGHPLAFLRAVFTSEQALRSYYMALF
jgi:pimeloyl-ACP methyl ester carboxylesterase